MKILRLLFAVVIGLFSNLTSAQEVKVDFDVEGFPDSIAYIGYYMGSQKYVLDTLDVVDDHFTLELNEVSPGLYFVYTPNYFQEFVMDGGSFALKTTKEGMYKNLEVINSKENLLFKDFQVNLGGLQKEQRELASQLSQASSAADSTRIRDEMLKNGNLMASFKEELVSNNPDSFLAGFLGLMEDVDVPEYDSISDQQVRRQQQYLYYKSHYFDQVDLNDGQLLRTPIIHDKVMKYFDQLVPNSPDSINFELDKILGTIQNSPDAFRYWLVTFFKKYTQSKVMGMDAVTVHLIENYYLNGDLDWISPEYEKSLREEVAYVKPNLIGSQAPPLNVVDSLLNPFLLSQIQSPYTLLFIYDPDCGHCKESIKELEDSDSQLVANDIQVVAVATITDVSRWRQFINEANPMWEHAIDPSGKSYFRVSYNVRSTPKIYLLDANKTIIGKQLNVEQIVDLVGKLNK